MIIKNKKKAKQKEKEKMILCQNNKDRNQGKQKGNEKGKYEAEEDLNEETNYKPKKSKEAKRKDPKVNNKLKKKTHGNYDDQSEKRPLGYFDSINRAKNNSLSLSDYNDNYKSNDNNKNNLTNNAIDYIDIEDLKLKCSSTNFLSAHGDIDNSTEAMEQLYIDLQMKHPCKIDNGEITKIPICANVGCYCCCQKCQRSDIEGLGIGLMIYFKLMKGFLFSFFIIALLYIPVYYIYFSNRKDKIAINYNDFLFKTTIGNIASTVYNCKQYDSRSVIGNTNIDFDLNCTDRKITEVLAFGTAKDKDQEESNNLKCFNFLSINEIKIGEDCDMTKNFSLGKDCENENTCKTRQAMTIYNDCKPASNITQLYLVYSCYNESISLGDIPGTILRSDFGYVIASVDLFAILLIIGTLSCIDFKQKREYDDYRQTRTFIRDFTLSMNNLVVPSGQLVDEIGDLVTHFKKIMSTEEASQYLMYTPNNELDTFNDYHCYTSSLNQKSNYCLFEIIYPKFTCEKLDANKKIHKLQKKLHKLQIKKGITTITKKETIDENSVVIHEHNHKSEKDKKEIQLEEKIVKLNAITEKNSQIKEVKEFYLTFRNNRIATYINEKYKISKCNRCCIICLCKKEIISQYYYKEKWLNLSFARDEPTNLKWENMTYSSCKRCLRKTFSICIAVILLAATVIAIFYSKQAQAQMAEEYNLSVDCSHFSISENTLATSLTDNSKSNGEMKMETYCFCLNQMTLSDIFTNEIGSKMIEGTFPCQKFIELYIKSSILNTLIIIVIPIVNTIVMIIFKALTSFERNKTLSKDMNSNLWKIFIITFINSGLLLVIINLRVEFFITKLPKFPFFAGSFSDFDPEWYKHVGVVILFSMALDIITPHAASLLFMLINYITRCCDGGCSGGKKTKALTKEDYFNIYTGPEFEIDGRYACLLSSFFVLMMFSPGLPFLYLCFFLNLLITYCVDKVLILKFYRNPPKYDLGIVKTFLAFCFVAVLIHFPFAIWIYGNPFLLVDRSPNKLFEVKEFLEKIISANNDIAQIILTRISYGHNLILIVGFLSIILLFIIISIANCVKLMSGKKQASLQKGLNSLSNVEIGLGISLRDAYKNYIIKEMEYVMLKKQPPSDQIKSQLDNLIDGLLYLRSFIIYKLEKLTDRTYPKLRTDFNVEIRKVKELFSIEKKGLIAEDVSYDILFNPEFEAAAFDDYMKLIDFSS